MSVKIDKIVIKIGDKKIELTMEELKQLESALKELRAKECVPWSWPIIPNPRPTLPNPDKFPVPYKPYEVWCTTSSNTPITMG